MIVRLRAQALLSTVVLLLTSCGDGDGGDGKGPGSTTFTGVLSGTYATVALSVQAASPAPPSPTAPALRDQVNVTGRIIWVDTGTELTGTYDPATKQLYATNGHGIALIGNVGVFSGTERMDGFWLGDGGLGGAFVATSLAVSEAQCGSYAADDQSDTGTFNFVLADGVLLGQAASDRDGGTVLLNGTVSGSAITIDLPGGGGTLASGTISGSTAAGTFDNQQGTTGTWSTFGCAVPRLSLRRHYR